MNANALAILSGGQDSTTALFWALHKFGHVAAITFDYGQRHAIEIDAASKVAEMAQADHYIVRVPQVLSSTSPLTSETSLETYDNYEQMDATIGDRVELTFVPMRNPFFFVVAANKAIAIGCRHLVTGICQEDNANYPDCREDFRSAFEKMTNLALGLKSNPVQLHAPLMNMTKAESVRFARSMPRCWEALAYTHTAYDGNYPPVSKDHASILRAHGFEAAGLPDPLVLRAVQEGLMPLPATANYHQ